ncbi:retrotransposon-related protein, partial [Trifolium pratense]
MRVLILGEGETLNEGEEIVALEVDESEGVVDTKAECKLIGVLGKIGEYNTMKLEGKLVNLNVEVLIDSGDSHSFISPELTTTLGLTVTPTTIERIKLGNGHIVLSEGICRGTRLTFRFKTFKSDALVLELGGMDVILGVSWLSSLGKAVMDWKDLSMQFWRE